MKLHPLLLGSAIALALAACNDTSVPSEPTAPRAAPTEVSAPPATGETQAFYGDEAPVVVPAEPADDHGHPHDGDAGHTHGDAGHLHGDSTHSHEDDEHDEPGHKQGDGSEPHDH
jgi:hypothetical protein